MKFEHLGGGAHETVDGKMYKKGDIVTSSVDLEKQFVGKFKRVDHLSPAAPATATVPISPPASVAVTDPPSEKKKIVIRPKGKELDARGTEVTDNFDSAEQAGIKVFQRADLFHFYDGDKTSPLNKTGLKKSEVKAAIAKYLEE